DGIDLQGVVALDGYEAVGPRTQGGLRRIGIPGRVSDRVADALASRLDSRKGNWDRVDFRAIEIVQVHWTLSAWTGNRRIGRVLIGPCCVTSGLVNDAEDGVGAREVPRHNRLAVICRIARQARSVDGIHAAATRGSAAVQLRLVDIDTFFVFRRGAVEHADLARTCGDTVAGGLCRRRERTIVRNVIENAFGTG